MLGVLMSALDNTVIGTAMPAVVRDLGGMEHFSWPFTAYLLASALAVPIFGRLADSVGRRTVFAAGLIEFMLASALCGLSGDMGQLILWRGLQGVGGGVIVSGAFSIVAEMAPPRERGKYIGLVAAMFGVASVFGPTVGGFLTEHLGWQYNFYVNLPVGVISLAILLAGMAGVKEARRKPRIDWPGIACFAASIVPLMIALATGGRDWPWLSAPVLGLFGLCLVAGIAFVLVERRVAEPLMPPFLFADREFAAVLTTTFLSNAVFFAAILFLPLYLQEVLKVTVLGSGLALTPLLLCYSAASIACGQIVSRVGHYRTLAIGANLAALLAMAALAWLPASAGQWPVISLMALLGLGLGLTVPIGNLAGQSRFGLRHVATTTAVNQFCRTIGAALGAAVCGGLMTAQLDASLAGLDWGQTPAAVKDTLSNPKVLTSPSALAELAAQIPPAWQDFFQTLQAKLDLLLGDAVHTVFWAGALFALLALAASLAYRRDMRLDLGDRQAERPGADATGTTGAPGGGA
jgi:EmrB/QacA subfamily drug resistance transporter